jgi:hypothetical protein
MVVLEAILKAVNVRKHSVLLFAQVSMRPEQFTAFRKLFLREFGRDGLEQELARIVCKRDTDRHG